MTRHARQNTGSRDAIAHRGPHRPALAAVVGCCPHEPGKFPGRVMGWSRWSMVPSRQRPAKQPEAILFRELLHRSLEGARFFQHVDNNFQPVRVAWHGGGGGGGGINKCDKLK